MGMGERKVGPQPHLGCDGVQAVKRGSRSKPVVAGQVGGGGGQVLIVRQWEVSAQNGGDIMQNFGRTLLNTSPPDLLTIKNCKNISKF